MTHLKVGISTASGRTQRHGMAMARPEGLYAESGHWHSRLGPCATLLMQIPSFDPTYSEDYAGEFMEQCGAPQNCQSWRAVTHNYAREPPARMGRAALAADLAWLRFHLQCRPFVHNR